MSKDKKKSPAPARGAEKAAAPSAAEQAALGRNPAAAAEEAAAKAAAGQAALQARAAQIPDSMLPRSAPEEDRPKLKMLMAMFPPTKPGQIFMLPTALSWLYILTGCFFLWVQGFSTNIAQTNLSKLEGYFHTTAVETTWLVSAYLAPYASFVILLTKVRTQIGVRRFTVIALICFTIASLLHAVVSDYRTALILRFCSGLAAAPLSSIAVLYIMTPLVPLKKITSGISIAMLNLAIGTPVAHIIGANFLEFSDYGSFCLLQFGLACLALVLMAYLPSMDMPKMKVLEKWDFISYPLIALGLGLNAAVLPVGKLYWWHDADWIGWALAIAIICLTLAALIELNRKTPLIDFRWLFSGDMLRITIIILFFRVLIADQSTLLGTYFSYLGLQNIDLVTLYVCIAGGTAAGGLICVFLLEPGRRDYFFVIAMAAIAIGSYTDSFSTILTRPPQMYLTQALIGFGLGLFLPTALSGGVYAALMRGPQYVVSFTAIFLFTQCTGSVMSSAFFGSVQIILEKFHSAMLTQHLTLSNPLVAERITMLAAPYKAQITDPAQLQGIGLNNLAQQATQQANILAFNDVFRIYAYIAAFIFCLMALHLCSVEYRRFSARRR